MIIVFLLHKNSKMCHLGHSKFLQNIFFKKGSWAPMAIEMNKRINHNLSSQDLRNALAKENLCYVLITCAEPAEDGKMEVEMTFEGDASLAAYLLESAQNFIETQDD